MKMIFRVRLLHNISLSILQLWVCVGGRTDELIDWFTGKNLVNYFAKSQILMVKNSATNVASLRSIPS